MASKLINIFFNNEKIYIGEGKDIRGDYWKSEYHKFSAYIDEKLIKKFEKGLIYDCFTKEFGVSTIFDRDVYKVEKQRDNSYFLINLNRMIKNKEICDRIIPKSYIKAILHGAKCGIVFINKNEKGHHLILDTHLILHDERF